MVREPRELARGGYECGRRAEQREVFEWLEGFAEYVGTVCALAYLDGREDGGEEQGDLNLDRIETANRVRAGAADAFRTVALAWHEQKVTT